MAEKRKVDPKDPKTNPNRARAEQVAQENMRQWEAEGRFETPGQKSDYLREVGKNPNNLPGLPVFYPALQIRSAMNSKNVKYCVKCDYPVATATSKCDRCGYQPELCKNCNAILITRRDDAGIIHCFNCWQPIGVTP